MVRDLNQTTKRRVFCLLCFCLAHCPGPGTFDLLCTSTPCPPKSRPDRGSKGPSGTQNCAEALRYAHLGLTSLLRSALGGKHGVRSCRRGGFLFAGFRVDEPLLPLCQPATKRRCLQWETRFKAYAGKKQKCVGVGGVGKHG